METEAESLLTTLEELPDDFLDGWIPHEPADPAEWVEENIYFSAKDGAAAGYWSHDRFPYSLGPLHVMTDDEVQEIVLMWGTQLGKTTLLGAWVCWIRENCPSSIMIACSDKPAAQEHYETKLEPMLESCPPIAKDMLPKHRRKKSLVDLGNCWIYYAYSGGKATLSSRSIRFLAINEINLWTSSKSREGGPVQMARDRTKAFPNRKILIEGKPTVVGDCRITAAYEQSDQRTYHVPCPHCGAFQPLEMGDKDSVGGLKWEKKDGQSYPEHARKTAWYECKFCRGRITDQHKLQIMREGQWVRKGQRVERDQDGQPIVVGVPEKPGKIAGFYMDSLYSSMITFGEYAEAFLKAVAAGPSELRAFWNSWRCLPWEVASRKVVCEEIRDHTQEYELGFVPEPALALVCTVDVQESLLYYVVRAWGFRADSWLINYGILRGWPELSEVLQRFYPGEGGEEHLIRHCWIDSGYGKRRDEVLQFCARYPSVCVPIKGEHQYRQAGMIQPTKIPQYRLNGWNIDAGQIRDRFYEFRLNIKPGDPGYWALPSNVRADYIRAILSWERIEEKDDNGKLKMIWVSKSPDFEHWGDCEIYQEAAATQHQFHFRRAPDQQRKPKRRILDGRGRYAAGPG